MNGFTLVRRNLARNKLRTTLLLTCIAIAFMIFGVLGSVLSAFQLKDQLTGAERLMVTNRVGLLQTVPIAYVDQVRRLGGVKTASPVRLAIVFWREPKDVISAVMVDPEPYLGLSADTISLSAADRTAFLGSRDGLLVGRTLAERYGWKRGDHVTLTAFNDLSEDGSRAWRFTVAGIYTARQPNGPELGIAGHLSYYNEALLTARDRVNWIVLDTRDPANNDSIARQIDAQFANSPAATKTQSESALARAFLGQIGDLVTIVRLIVGTAFVIILLVVGNTLVFQIAERTREIGVLKTLGFSSARIARLVGGEVATLALVGGGIGLLLATWIVGVLGGALKDVIPGVVMSASIVATGLALVVLLATVTGVVPVLNACRLKIIVALGRRA